MRKRIGIVLAFALGLSAIGVAALAGVNATPEVDRPNATMQLAGKFKSVTCVGEDGGAYATFSLAGPSSSWVELGPRI